MRFWLARDTSVPLREQLSAQIILGILSRTLSPGQRLPSVRELARRLKIHANTVSAVYQDLADRGWVAQRRGSGVFVSAKKMPALDRTAREYARACFAEGLNLGFTTDELHSAFAGLTAVPEVRRFLVIDPDAALARVMAAEIQEAVTAAVSWASLSEALESIEADTCVLLNPAHSREVLPKLGDARYRCIELKSMEEVLAGHQRPSAATLIGVASQSESILEWAATLLSALGFSPDHILLRNAGTPNWLDGLTACDFVAADVVTAAELRDPVVFRTISPSFLANLQAFVTASKV